METSKRLDIERAQNFMRKYRDPQSRELRQLTSHQFIEVWSHYDRDGLYWHIFAFIYFRFVNYLFKWI